MASRRNGPHSRVAADPAYAERVRRTLEATGGNKTAAAELLGCDRKQLIRHAQELGLAEGRPPAPAGPDAERFRRFLEWEAGQVVAPPAAPPALLPAEPSTGGLVHAPKPYAKVLVFPDAHCGGHSVPATDAVLDFAESWKPDLFLILGDFQDFHSISRHQKDPEVGQILQEEIDAGRPLRQRIDALGCDVAYLKGNHEFRLDSLIWDNPALSKLRALRFGNVLELPERWKVYPDQTRYRIGGLDFLHGNLRGRGTGAKHIAAWAYAKLKRSCVLGHFHRINTHLESDGDGVTRGGFALGHLADPKKMADFCPVNEWTQGFGVVEFDHDPAHALFHVEQLVIVNGRFRRNGVTYGG